ncbi:PHP domain-containing protein [Desulfonatronum parangueonense]
MRIDCHFHSSQYSCCSHVSPQRACEIALSRGLNALLFTEHGIYWSQEKLDELQAQYPDLKLFSGIEIALNEGYHIVAFGIRFLDRQIHLMPLNQLISMVAKDRENIFFFVAHAFRYQPYPLPELPQILKWCDGLEMNSINILRGHHVRQQKSLAPSNHALYQKHLREFKLTPLYNSDGHDEDIIGLIANEFPDPDPPNDEVELARLFKTQRPTEYQNPELLSLHYLLNTPEYY